MRPKNFNLFLIDGDARGRVKCTLRNWTGIAYKIPRTELEKSRDRVDLSQSGVYFLFGKDELDEKEVVYIGQAGVRQNGEGLLGRLFEHRRNEEKNYWNEAIVFTTSDDSFGPTEISYLEHRFVKMAQDAGRYSVKNSVLPTAGNVREEIEAEMEEFIENAVTVMGILGHMVFEPLVEEKDTHESLELFLERTIQKTGITLRAKCLRTKEGFVVLKGSDIGKYEAPSLQPHLRERRRSAKINNGTLMENELFKSPSAAAAFVIGGSINGLAYWKTSDGVSLKELDDVD